MNPLADMKAVFSCSLALVFDPFGHHWEIGRPLDRSTLRVAQLGAACRQAGSNLSLSHPHAGGFPSVYALVRSGEIPAYATPPSSG
jgi:hypothetical protein